MPHTRTPSTESEPRKRGASQTERCAFAERVPALFAPPSLRASLGGRSPLELTLSRPRFRQEPSIGFCSLSHDPRSPPVVFASPSTRMVPERSLRRATDRTARRGTTLRVVEPHTVTVRASVVTRANDANLRGLTARRSNRDLASQAPPRREALGCRSDAFHRRPRRAPVSPRIGSLLREEDRTGCPCACPPTPFRPSVLARTDVLASPAGSASPAGAVAPPFPSLTAAPRWLLRLRRPRSH